MLMLTPTDVNLLRMMALGFGAREIATTLKLELKEFSALYAELLHKTKCWDEIGLGAWWQQNQHKYKDVCPDNLVAFDFTKL